jgi:type III restriction enzyme
MMGLRRRATGENLIVEYKGANNWATAEDDRVIGGLGEALSGGKCRFVMVTDKKWDMIEAKLK